jgi:hypothetical protein
MRCPVCESPRLSEPYPYAAFENTVRIPGGAQGLLGPKTLAVGPSHARICGGCGHVMFFLSDEDLEKVRPHIR